MRFAFFGTDDFSVIVLEKLKKAELLPALVVTAPNRPKGRGLKLSPPPVKVWAQENGVEFMQPITLDSSASYRLKAKSYQLFIVASYGLILPKEILEIPGKGALNVHPSLLPKYRGATPIESQILADEKEVGVTIMLMDEEIDHGAIIAQRNLPPATDNQPPKAGELRKQLAREGGELLAEAMLKWVRGEIAARPQDERKATYTKKLAKADGEINLSDSPYKNFLKIRAFDDSIGSYFFAPLNSPFCKARPPGLRPSEVGRGSTRVSEGKGFSPFPKSSAASELGTSFKKGGMGNKNIRVLIKDAEFKDGQLIITRVVPEGKKEMSYEEFLRGLK